MKLFDHIDIYSYEDLDDDFRIEHKWILNFSRLGGYSIWKPYLILKTFADMTEGDVLVYADAGCTIRTQGRNRMNEYFKIVRTRSGVLGFETREHIAIKTKYPRFLEKEWNKMSIIKLLGAERFLDTVQLAAGAIIFCKNDHSQKLVEEWYRVAKLDHYHYLDDSPSIVTNHSDFVEHRHEQSIYSLLAKKMGVVIMSDELLLYHHSLELADCFPIWASRIRC